VVNALPNEEGSTTDEISDDEEEEEEGEAVGMEMNCCEGREWGTLASYLE
jgi:hypothetical protein